MQWAWKQNSFFFLEKSLHHLTYKVLEEGRGDLGEYREKLGLVSLTNAL